MSAHRQLLTLLFALLLASSSGSPAPQPQAPTDDDDAPGSALPVTGAPKPNALEATFTERSYRPGETAELRVATRASRLSVRIFRAGGGHDGPLQGQRVGRPVDLIGSETHIGIADWPSGLYYARLEDGHSRLGYAPFVVRPRRLGEHRIAVVLPTNTWQAYNFYDENGDGKPDSWYGNPAVSCAHLSRPFLDRGVPPHYTGYDRGFMRWLARTGKHVDFLTDDDLEHVARGDALARAYDLVVFSGHEEYVTTHAYDAVDRYRDLGGNLMFLSANNFFYRVERHGDRICRDGRWRDLGRPEAALVGIQYVDWYQERYKNRPYAVAGADRVQWAFRGTGLGNGDSFGLYGIEIDARATQSPPALRILARIPDIFGPGKSAEMTYYTTPRGAKVFAAGVINFGGTAMWPGVRELIGNLWRELSRP